MGAAACFCLAGFIGAQCDRLRGAATSSSADVRAFKVQMTWKVELAVDLVLELTDDSLGNAGDQLLEQLNLTKLAADFYSRPASKVQVFESQLSTSGTLLEIDTAIAVEDSYQLALLQLPTRQAALENFVNSRLASLRRKTRAVFTVTSMAYTCGAGHVPGAAGGCEVCKDAYKSSLDDKNVGCTPCPTNAYLPPAATNPTRAEACCCVAEFVPAGRVGGASPEAAEGDDEYWSSSSSSSTIAASPAARTACEPAFKGTVQATSSAIGVVVGVQVGVTVATSVTASISTSVSSAVGQSMGSGGAGSSSGSAALITQVRFFYTFLLRRSHYSGTFLLYISSTPLSVRFCISLT